MYYFVAIMHLFSQSLSIVLRCGGLLLNATFSFSSAWCIRWPGFFLIRVSCCWVIDVMLLGYVCCTRLIRIRTTVCSASFLSAFTRVRHARAAAAAHPLEFEVSRYRTFKFARGFLPAQVLMWNDLPYTVFDTMQWMGLIVQATVGWFQELCFFFSFPWRRCLWDCESNL